MNHRLKTLRDLGLSAAITLGLFGTPVGAAAIKNVTVMPTAIELPAEEFRVVTIPAPPAPVEQEDSEEGQAAEKVADSTEEAASGAPGLAVERALSRRGAHITPAHGSRSHAGKAKAAKAGKRKRTRRANRCTPDNPQIVVSDGGLRVVDRSLVDHYAGNIPELNRLGYIKKHQVEGSKKSDGLLVRGIRCGNDLHELGIRNNDVVHSVNGKKVKNLLQAITVYFQIRGQEDFRVELTRGGRRVTLRYELT